MKKQILLIGLVLLAACSVAAADTVFSENFSGGTGHFSGFGANGCQWQTPGDFSTLLSYFGDDEYAEIARTGCGLPTFWDEIISDNIDLSNYEDAVLSFDHSFHGLSFTGASNVELSIDGGANYTNVYSSTFPDDQGIKSIDISSADGRPNVKIRFYFWYYGGVLFDSYWGLDDVTITATSLGDDDTVDDDVVDDDTIDDDTADDDAVDDDAIDDDVIDDDDDDDAVDDDDTTDDDAADDDATNDDDDDNILDDDDDDDDDDDNDDGGGCAC